MTDSAQVSLAELNTVLPKQFPAAASVPIITQAEEGMVRVRWNYEESLLRPGGTISGPTLMTLADIAAYMAILSAVGIDRQAVTSNLTMHFLGRPPAADLEAVGRVRRAGGRQWVIAVDIYSVGSTEPVADALVGYALID